MPEPQLPPHESEIDADEIEVCGLVSTAVGPVRVDKLATGKSIKEDMGVCPSDTRIWPGPTELSKVRKSLFEEGWATASEKVARKPLLDIEVEMGAELPLLKRVARLDGIPEPS